MLQVKLKRVQPPEPVKYRIARHMTTRFHVSLRSPQSKSVTKLLWTTGFCLSIEYRFCLFPIVTNGNYHSSGEALDIYDILKLTHNGILEEDTDTEQDRAKGGISQSSK